MVDVQGDSMKDAGILDGDSVLVERTTAFKDGEIVVALMEDGYTIKHLKKRFQRNAFDACQYQV